MDTQKPVMLYNYEYSMTPWESRKADSFTYQLEEALKEFFTIVHRGDVNYLDVDVIFNTLPLSTVGNTDPASLFLVGKKTYFWNPIPLEGLFPEVAKRCDVVFTNVPSMVKEYGDKGELLLSAVNPNYKFYPEEADHGFRYDIGFLGSEIVEYRTYLLHRLDEKFTLMRGAASGLGEPSARMLSRCKLVMSIDDYWDRHAGIEHRLWTFGNVRPLLVEWNDDYLEIGDNGEHFAGYHDWGGAADKIEYYLNHMDEAEAMHQNLLKEFEKKHTWHHRAKQVYERFLCP